uniref:Fatty acid desaturase domain-containing protein n=1 Tax=Kalanchoe fedtschenkoi TaxID=63787 RepID=A0A7N0VAF4_KALFE
MALKMVQSSFLVSPPHLPHHRQFFVRRLTSPHVDNRMLSLKDVASQRHNSIVSPVKGVSSLDVERPKPRPFWGRRWHPSDVVRLLFYVSLHVLCLLAPFYFTWPAFWVGLSLYIIIGSFGITLSYHKNLAHRSFTLPKWLEYTFAYCGILAGQGSPIDWCACIDPHSPIEGFWFSHLGWMFNGYYLGEKFRGLNNVGDLRKQSFYRFLKKTQYLHYLAPGLFLYAIGGIPFVVWGMGVRIVAFFHATFFVNSVCHLWGQRAWNTGDTSRNNWWVALLTFGEGWHNNHHAFEYSARQGLEWWQVDVTWGVIRLLEVAELATDVKLPTEEQKKKMKLKN